MNRLFALLMLAMLLPACTSFTPREWTADVRSKTILSAEELAKEPADGKLLAEQERWRQLAAQPTPSSWQVGAQWEFNLYRGRWQSDGQVVFEVTNEPAISCIGGRWKKLRLLSESKPRLASSPAYLAEGRTLQIELTTGLCDAYNTLTGELDEDAFLGKHESFGLMHYALYGRATGRPRAGLSP